MRIRILLLLSFFMTTSLYAQEQSINSDNKDPFYMEHQLGANHSLNENSRFTKFWNSEGWTIAFLVGKEFTPLWGWRASVGYSLNRGQNTWKDKDNSSSVSFYDLEMFGDITLDLTDWWFPNRKSTELSLKGFLGAGYLHSFKFGNQVLAQYEDYCTDPVGVYGFRGGLNLSYRFSPYFTVAAETSLTAMDDKFNGVINKRFLDGRLNLNIGLIWYLQRNKHVTPPPANVTIQPIKKVDITPVIAYAIPKIDVVKRSIVEGKANLDFRLNKVNIDPTYRKNPTELMTIRETVDRIVIDTTTIISNIIIHGYASPEGSYSNNARLAKGRAESLMKYLRELYLLPDSIFTIEYTPEYWDGLRQYVAESNMESKQKLLNIIDSPVAPDIKNKQLASVNDGKDYKFLLNVVYPSLRHLNYAVKYSMLTFDIEKGKKLIYTHPDMLSLEEMFCIAQSYGEQSENCKRTLMIAAHQYPNSPEANMNAACVALENKQLVEAKLYLEKAGNSPEAIHARGVLASMEGDYDLARELFKQSSAAGIKESDEMMKQLP